MDLPIYVHQIFGGNQFAIFFDWSVFLLTESKRFHFSSSSIAFLFAFLGGFFTHLFALVNLINNHDNLNNQPFGYGAGVSSGRWLLQYLGEFFTKIGIGYNLPFVSGVLFLLLLSLSAYFLVSTLRIKSCAAAALIGCLMTTIPAVASTLYYRFTAVYYGIAILLSVLAAWLLEKNCRFFPLSALCIGCALGIYQAYTPITIGIFVLILLRQCLENHTSLKQLFIKGLHCCVALALGLAVYLIGTKLSLRMAGTTLTDYQGINEMGSLSLSMLPELMIDTIANCILLPFRDYCGLAYSNGIRLIWGLLGLMSLVLIGWILWKQRNLFTALAAGILLLVFPVAVDFIVIMSPTAYVYTLMVYPFFLLGCLPAVVLDCLDLHIPWKKYAEKALSILLSLLCVFYMYQTHVNYTALHFANQRASNYVSTLVAQIRMTEGYTPELEWVFLGELQDPLLGGSLWETQTNIGGASAHTNGFLSSYSLKNWLRDYFGYNVPYADEETKTVLIGSPEVEAMPCWPSAGSIKVIGDTVVIKFED